MQNQKKSVLDEYSELMHYTTAAGLTGILSSQSIWATHAAHLNDMEETSLFFKERLPAIAGELWNQHGATSQLATAPDKASQMLDALCQSIKNVTLKFNEPYVFSMCGAENERTRKNGLLSQWRAYGRDGGYAIVFDTQGLQSLLEHEGEEFHYQHLQWGDVFYNDPLLREQKAQPEIEEAENHMRELILGFLNGKRECATEETYRAVTMLSCLYKHWGFQEEKEVRIVAIPINQRVRKESSNLGQKKVKTPKSFVREGSPIPFIELAPDSDESGRRPLPIKRVIVGPHRNKEQRKKAVELMLSELGIQAEVAISEIPFTGC